MTPNIPSACLAANMFSLNAQDVGFEGGNSQPS